MTSIKSILVAFGVSLSLVACKSTNVMVLEPQVEVPEVAGRTGDVGVRAIVTPARSLRLARYAEARPPNLSLRSEETEQSIAALGAETGLGAKFEVGAMLGTGIVDSGCAGVGAKYQAYGPSRATAKAGDVAIGISAHANACQSRDEGYSLGPIGPEMYPWKIRSTSQVFDLGASLGYHVYDLLMVYGGVALGTTRAEAVIDQDAAGTSAGGTYSSHANGEAQTLAVGVNYGGPSVWVNARGVFVHSNSDYVNPDHTSLGLGFGAQF